MCISSSGAQAARAPETGDGYTLDKRPPGVINEVEKLHSLARPAHSARNDLMAYNPVRMEPDITSRSLGVVLGSRRGQNRSLHDLIVLQNTHLLLGFEPCIAAWANQTWHASKRFSSAVNDVCALPRTAHFSELYCTGGNRGWRTPTSSSALQRARLYSSLFDLFRVSKSVPDFQGAIDFCRLDLIHSREKRSSVELLDFYTNHRARRHR